MNMKHILQCENKLYFKNVPLFRRSVFCIFFPLQKFLLEPHKVVNPPIDGSDFGNHLEAQTSVEHVKYTNNCNHMFWRCLVGHKYRTRRLPSGEPEYVHSVSRIDMFSRYAFPSSFLLFNVCYWCYYYNTVE